MNADPAPRSLSVLVPFYNERATLRPSIDRLLKADLPVEMEVLLVDDGSSDGGVETVRDLVDAGRVRLVRHRTNLGKGAAIRTALKHATGDIVTILDADLEYDPHDYPDLLRPILEEEATVVYGTRSFGAHTSFSFWYVIGNRLIAFWASFLFDTWISDVETCFKMAPTDVWRSLGLRSRGFGIEAEATGKFLRAGHRIYEVPIGYRARGREEGKKLDWTDGVDALWILLRERLRRRSG
jgi:glycosyltransferase involved in cell wall biosynthesis